MTSTMLYWISAILLAAFVTLSLRSIPFFLFRGEKTMPEWLKRLGDKLPPAMMAVLLVYCLKDLKTSLLTTGYRELLALLVVFLVHKWKHNTFFSIFVSTVFYMILLRL